MKNYLLNVTFYAGSDEPADVDTGLYLLSTPHDKLLTLADFKNIFHNVNLLMDPWLDASESIELRPIPCEQNPEIGFNYERGLNIDSLMTGIESYLCCDVVRLTNETTMLGEIDAYYEIHQWQ